MSEVWIELDEAKFAAIRSMLAGFPRALPRIVAGSINKVATAVRTDTARELAKEYTLKQKFIRGRLRLRKAKSTARNPIAAIYIDEKPLGLHLFSARQVNTGVSYKIGKKGGRSVLPAGFMQTANNARLVFKRVAGGDDPDGRVDKHGGQTPSVRRYPIAVQRGPGIREMFHGDPAFATKIEAKAAADLTKHVDAAVKRYLWARQKFGK
jgi:hypothetical protein